MAILLVLAILAILAILGFLAVPGPYYPALLYHPGTPPVLHRRRRRHFVDNRPVRVAV